MIPASLHYGSTFQIKKRDNMLQMPQGQTRLEKQSGGETKVPLFKLLFKVFGHILPIFIHDIQLGIARYFDIERLNVNCFGEKAFQVSPDHVFEENNMIFL